MRVRVRVRVRERVRVRIRVRVRPVRCRETPDQQGVGADATH